MTGIVILGNVEGATTRSKFCGKYTLYDELGVAPTVMASWHVKVDPAFVAVRGVAD